MMVDTDREENKRMIEDTAILLMGGGETTSP